MKLVALVIDDRCIARYLKARRADRAACPGSTPRAPVFWASTVLRRKTLADIDTTSFAAFDS